MNCRPLKTGDTIEPEDLFWDGSDELTQWAKRPSFAGFKHLGNCAAIRPLPDLPEPAWIKLSDQPPTYPAWVSDGVEVGFAAYSSIYGDRVYPDTFGMMADFDKRVTHWQPIGPKPAPPVPEKSAEDEAYERALARYGYYFPVSDLRNFFKAGIEFARKGAK